MQTQSTFYKSHDLYRYNNKNVLYVAYIGKYSGEDVYKYGKTSKLYEREYKAHRKNFERFDMLMVKYTDNKDLVEELFEKELKIRDIHRSITINGKRQTELFAVSEDYSIEYVIALLQRLIKDNPTPANAAYQRKIEELLRIIHDLKHN